jgi:hypothetical protein
MVFAPFSLYRLWKTCPSVQVVSWLNVVFAARRAYQREPFPRLDFAASCGKVYSIAFGELNFENAFHILARKKRGVRRSILLRSRQ